MVLRAWLEERDYTARAGFMSRDWDAVVPGPRTWREAFRVLKPGGHLLCFAGSRTFDLMSIAIRLAGFELRDTIDWIYLNGFPKSFDVSRMVFKLDPERAAQWKGWGSALKPSHEPILVFRKPFSTTAAENILTYGTGCMNIDACRVATAPGDEVEQHGRSAEAAVSKGIYGDSSAAEPGQTEGQKLGRWPPNTLFAHGPDCKRVGTDVVKALSGVRPNAIGKDYGPQDSVALGQKSSRHGMTHADADGNEHVERWECQPGCPVAELNQQSGERPVSGAAKTGRSSAGCDGSGVTGFDNKKGNGPMHNDKGGAARMFPCFDWSAERDDPVLATLFHYFAKPSTAEREAGCEDLAKRPQDTGRESDAPGANNPRNRGGKARGNAHPTVKPIALMRWCLRLVVPPGGLVADIFGGSGTTGCAAELEHMQYVLVECDPESVAVARARCEHWRGKA